MSSNLDTLRQWQCRVCNATTSWPARRRGCRCDDPRDHSSPGNDTRGPLGRAPRQGRNTGPPSRSSGPRPIPPRNFGNGPLAGAGTTGAELGKNEEGGDLLQALSLPQKIMTPKNFAKHQGMVWLPGRSQRKRGNKSWLVV